MSYFQTDDVFRIRVSPCLFGALVAVATAAPPVQRKPHEPPKCMSVSDWSRILGAYEANRHAAFAVEGGYVARNPGQQWQAHFEGRGFVVTPDAGADDRGAPAWIWGLELVRYGRSDQQRMAFAPQNVEAHGGYVEYEWDDTLTEWFINDPGGLEHGFTVHHRPQGDGTPLCLTLAMRGGLRPCVSNDGRNVAFTNGAGLTVLNYNGLTVLDAGGVALPAWFETDDATLTLRVDDRAARYPLTIDPIAQQAYLKASNTEASDNFGYSVGVSGDTVVVGAYQEDSNATGVNGNQANNSASRAGAAYVFVRSGGVWTQQAYLKASNTGANDTFGCAVALSGDTVVVGARLEDSNATGVNGNGANNSASDAGAAYVFVRSGGVWSQQAYLKASNTETVDYFGCSVAVSDDTVVVGAYAEDSNATGVNGNQADNSFGASGAAYVFVRSGGVWSQQAYLKASNTEATDVFGYSVAASGDTVVVGTNSEDSNATGVNGNQTNNSAQESGAAYVFVRDGGVWSQQAYLKASNTGAADQFGDSVSVSGDTVVVGAYGESSNATGVNGNQTNNNAVESGAAYVFVRDGGVWSQQAYLKASNTGAGDQFGDSVSVSGDTVVVGAEYEDSNASGVNGNGANNSAFDAGAAYVFFRSGGVWSQQAYLKASNTEAADQFGTSVSVSGDSVLVGALFESSNATGVNGNQADNSALFSGAAYVFTGVGCPTLGNLNCDCTVEGGDVGPFLLALLDPAGYSAAFPGCDILRGDMQPDGAVNGADVQAFVDLLIP